MCTSYIGSNNNNKKMVLLVYVFHREFFAWQAANKASAIRETAVIGEANKNEPEM